MCLTAEAVSVDLQAKYRHLLSVKERGVEDVIRMGI